MYRILDKKQLNSTVTQMDILAPAVARKAQAGQFVILRVDEKGERIPLTIAGFDREAGSVRIIFQIVGATTMLLNAKNAGESICDFVGPLGRPTDVAGMKRVLVVGGGVGCAIALPVARRLHEEGAFVHAITGFRTSELVILSDEFSALGTEPLRQALEAGGYDCMIAIGPLPMMKFAVRTCAPFGIRTVVSMNPIMIDGTGMCGCCRLTVGGRMKFACVDGPDFDGYEVDFDEAISRSSHYRTEEARARDAACNLLRGGV